MLTVLFHQYGLVANTVKSKVMKFHPCTIRSRMLDEVVGRWCMGRGATYRKRLRRRVPVPDYGLELTAVSMIEHRW